MRFCSAVQVTFALFIACCAAPAAAETARVQYLGSFNWHMDKPWFGGWSGIELSADGRKMTVITDRGYLMSARVTRSGDQITAIRPGPIRHLKASTGKYLARSIADSEGLVVSPDGQYYVSFEGVARVARYDTPTGTAVALPQGSEFREFEDNKALEALAMDANGRLYAVPEIADDDDGITVFALKNGVWSTPFTLNGGEGFLPVGADFGPDGQFYLLERGWNIFGFRTRLRRWAFVGGQPQQEQLLVQTRTGTHGNLEGVSVWRDPQGRTRITMISDDNFMFFQRTELVEYAVTE
ncbi:MAG: hypothetical protein ACI8R4_000080 [Paracoccaceae bacterium]|jgi:hypothetical protein